MTNPCWIDLGATWLLTGSHPEAPLAVVFPTNFYRTAELWTDNLCSSSRKESETKMTHPIKKFRLFTDASYLFVNNWLDTYRSDGVLRQLQKPHAKLCLWIPRTQSRQQEGVPCHLARQTQRKRGHQHARRSFLSFRVPTHFVGQFRLPWRHFQRVSWIIPFQLSPLLFCRDSGASNNDCGGQKHDNNRAIRRDG